MATTSTRVLRLLSLLQAKREWAGPELSEKLEVDVRTIRRDAERLRELGYVVESSAGPGGGYRLAAGAHTPPLLLDDEEALTVAIALSAIAGTFASVTDTALRVLVKLDQLLPSRLRRRWNALKDVTVALTNEANAVDATTLMTLAAACRDERRVVFKYGDRTKQETSRDVEPMRLVHTGRVWYLAAWDTQREDWRTFRLDRIDAKAGLHLGARFVAHQPPEDFATLVSRSISTSVYPYRARFIVPETLTSAKKKVPAWVGTLEPLDERRCVLSVGANSPNALVALLVNAGVDFELLEPSSLAAPLREIGKRLLRIGAPRVRRQPA